MSYKKAQGLSLTTVIIAAIVIIVLIVLVMIFTSRTGKFRGGVEKTESMLCTGPDHPNARCYTGTYCYSAGAEDGRTQKVEGGPFYDCDTSAGKICCTTP